MSVRITNAYLCPPEWSCLRRLESELVPQIFSLGHRRLMTFIRQTMVERMVHNIDLLSLGRSVVGRSGIVLSGRTPREITTHALRNDQLDCENSDSRSDQEYDFKGEMVFLTHPNTGQLAVIVFGHPIWMKAVKDRAQSLGLAEYDYYNGSDSQLDTLSVQEWEARNVFWREALRGWKAPAEVGYTRQLFSPPYSLLSQVKVTSSQWTRYSPSFEERVRVIADDIAFDEYVFDRTDNLSFTNLMRMKQRSVSEDRDVFQVYLDRWRSRYARRLHRQVPLGMVDKPVSSFDPKPPSTLEEWQGATVYLSDMSMNGYVLGTQSVQGWQKLRVRVEREWRYRLITNTQMLWLHY